jgi:hypothetical protein
MRASLATLAENDFPLAFNFDPGSGVVMDDNREGAR